jgi:hypothetical protein
MSYVLKSKERELCMAVYLSLSPIIKDFNSKLRGYFSRQQKEVIKNIKNDNVSFYTFYDRDKYISDFVKLYSEQIINIFKKALKRASAESDTEYSEDILKMFVEKYISETINTISQEIDVTTIKKLNRLFQQYSVGDITKEEFINQVNDYYNSDCKGWRSKEIALTEVYRAYNFAYFTYMVLQGYVWKKIIACFNSPYSKTKKINGQIKFYLEPFVIPEDNISGQFPPLHPNSRAILICLKENINT